MADKQNRVSAESLVRMAKGHRAKAAEYLGVHAEWPAKVHDGIAGILEEEAKEIRGHGKAAKEGG